ncbi:MAG: 50S ribosomal protein L18e [Caldisphaeraceae archaeon]|nr:50S ribosomal protein L18e [Caldisphaeraceae archaeon]
MNRRAMNGILAGTMKSLQSQYRKTKSNIWRYAAEVLSRPSRRRVAVNLNKINRFARDGDVILVPGKILGNGVLTKKVTLVAFSFSQTAIEKIRSAGSTYKTIEDEIRENPQGSNIKIIT